MTKTQELLGRADHFAARAVHAKGRTERNTCLSLEQSYRSLAEKRERFETAAVELAAAFGPVPEAVGA